MKLLVNLSTLNPKPTGLGVYTARCAEVAARNFDAEIIAPSNYRGAGRLTYESPQNIVLGASKYAGFKRWRWASTIRVSDDRLVYCPTHQGLSKSKNQILTVHDLTSIRFPLNHPLQSLYFKFVLPRQLARCRAVFTVSETTKIDIHEEYNVRLDSIHVVPNGVDTETFHVRGDVKREEFLLVVGANFAHKNIQELLENHRLWKSKYSLTIVSSRGKALKSLKNLVSIHGLEARVSFIEYATLPALVKLYQSCAALVYPSKWEGFGIPPLEALACGAKVIASDIPVLREVLGNSALFVKLGDPDSWATAFQSLERQVDTSDQPAEPVLRYSWENSGAALVKALKNVQPDLAQNAIG